jgi:acetoin utilization deacetylase AcuC-like enzyme
MRAVYDPSHVLHDPATEVQYGVPMPIYEVPARVESICAALLAHDEFSFSEPAGHRLGPVTAVHREGLVRFLAETWGLWRKHGEAVTDRPPRAG